MTDVFCLNTSLLYQILTFGKRFQHSFHQLDHADSDEPEYSKMSLFAPRENHVWFPIRSPPHPPAAPQSPTPAPCLSTMPPSPSLHYRRPQVGTTGPGVYRPLLWFARFPLTPCLLCSLLVCVYLNKYGKVGPHLDQRRVQQLPDHFGPGQASSVLQQCVQACVDSAHNQSTVFSCLKSGQGGEVISGEDYTRG